MKRRLVQLFFALGLLLMLAVGTLSVRGRFVEDRFTVRLARVVEGVRLVDFTVLSVDAAGFILSWDRLRLRAPPAARGTTPHLDTPGFTVAHNSLSHRSSERRRLRGQIGPKGFAFHRRSDRDMSECSVAAPAWFVVACSAVVTAVPGWLVWHRILQVRTRRAAGLCPACAYDLRGGPHERCPECGEPIIDAAQV